MVSIWRVTVPPLVSQLLPGAYLQGVTDSTVGRFQRDVIARSKPVGCGSPCQAISKQLAGVQVGDFAVEQPIKIEADRTVRSATTPAYPTGRNPPPDHEP